MLFFRSRFPLLLLWLAAIMLLSWGCGSGEECAKNGDCTDNPAFGAGYTCTKAEGKNVCTKACPSSCTAKADCAKCTGGKTFCVSGKCGFAPVECPASCSSDSDCGNCENGKNYCLGGVCDAKKPVCPSTCTADGDCTDCAGGNNSCISGTCGQTAKCEDSCTQDSDCSGCQDQKTTCVSGKCDKSVTPPQCPASCTAAADCAQCPDQRTSCEKGLCAISSQTQCPASCATDGDCSKCASGLNTCVAGKCSGKPLDCPANCNNDAECSKCPNGETSCIGGACDKPLNPQCPSTCANDNDCSSCPSDQQACVAGKCTKKTNPQCPGTCSNNTDCANCPASEQTCTNGTCGQAATCPATCSTNADCAPCGSGQRTCTSGKCGLPPACPNTCQVNSDCSKCTNGNISCSGGTCGKPTTCPGSCTLEADCFACGGNYDCTQSKCQPKKPPLTGPGQECSTSNRCITGDLCITLEGANSYCFQDCSSDATLCAKNTVDGRTKCTAFAQDSGGNTISVCMGEATKGQACGYGVKSQTQCKPGGSPPLYCNQKSQCAEAIIQTKVGDACNKSTDTSDPRKICDSASSLACSEATGKCETASVAKEGEACDLNGTNLGKIVRCDSSVSGLTCISFATDGSISFCQIVCKPTSANQCTHKTGLTCPALLTNGDGLCMDTTCTNDSDCVFPGYVCSPQTSGGNICLPPPPSGPKKYTEVCGTPARTKGCLSNLFCLREMSATDGYCTVDCTTAGTTCPRSGSLSASCETINSTTGTKACLFRCTTSTSPCPPGLKCNTSVGACLAP